MLLRQKEFFAFIIEREKIRQRKLANLPRPWTEDKILQEFKFTNVNRHHDWTTTRLREKFYSKHILSLHSDILLNAALFRFFGTVEFAEVIGWQTVAEFDGERIKKLAAERLKNKEKVFTGAYIIPNCGLKNAKQDLVVDVYIGDIIKNMKNLIDNLHRNNSWQLLSLELQKAKGVGSFMSKEILLDTMQTEFFSGKKEELDDYELNFPVDYDEWTPIGPGGYRGAARVFGFTEVKDQSLTEENALDIIKEIHSLQTQYWPFKKLHLTDIQFQFCEFDKYERVRLGQGFPRSKYKPRVVQ